MPTTLASWTDRPRSGLYGAWSASGWLTLLASCVRRADRGSPPATPPAGPPATTAQRSVRVATPSAMLDGSLAIGPRPQGLVVLIDASARASYAPGNRMVGEALRAAGFATLSVSLLAPGEQFEDCMTSPVGFDVSTCATRTLGILQWIATHPSLAQLPIGVYAAGNGAAAALTACASGAVGVGGVVCRGGRPELAGTRLGSVRTPTLFLVGENDAAMLAISRSAASSIGHGSSVAIVPGPRNLLADEHAIEPIARATVDWFAHVLPHRGTLPS